VYIQYPTEYTSWFAENANKIILYKTGAMRSKDDSLHTDQSACDQKIMRRRYYIDYAQTLPYRELRHFHSQRLSSLGVSRWSVKSTNPHLGFKKT